MVLLKNFFLNLLLFQYPLRWFCWFNRRREGVGVAGQSRMVWLALCLLGLFLPAAAQALVQGEILGVARVIDGDTIDIQGQRIRLHGIDAPNIVHSNTLGENISLIQEKDRYNVVLANPPFGGQERAEVQQNFPIKTGETAYLFLQHFIKILKAPGRGGVVIKNTTLSNTDNASPKGNWYQLLPNTVRPQWPRNSRATTSINPALPPWALNISNFLMPVRATPSPMSHHCEMRCAGDRLSVPSYAKCSLLKPTHCVGSTNTGSAGCKCVSAALTMALTKSVSTDNGKCGPCCSVAPKGSTATVRSGSSSEKSVLMQSAQ